MVQVIKPDSKQFNLKQRYSKSIFLAGTIEMGKSKDWQKEVEQWLRLTDVTIYNPRRDDWDSSWAQKQSNRQFNQQVNWELNMLEKVDLIFMNFEPDTISPISLFELGKYHNRPMIVCCQEEFARKGNVDIVCTRENIPLFNNFDDALGALETKINLLLHNHNYVR